MFNAVNSQTPATTVQNPVARPSNLSVNRERRRPVEVSELPLISIYPVREDVKRATENRRVQLVERDLEVHVLCRVGGNSSFNDPLRIWAVQQIMADQTLGGVAIEIQEESTDWNPDDDSSTDYDSADLKFRVRFQTNRTEMGSKV